MKKKLVLVAILASLTGCAALDGQDASKGQKVGEAAGVGAVLGAIVGHYTGISPVALAAFGGMLAGGMEYTRATNQELDLVKKQSDALKTAGIESTTKTVKVDVKDPKSGEVKQVTQLKNFVVHSTADDAVSSVASIAEKSPFGGQIVIVAPRSDKEHIQSIIGFTLTGKKMTDVKESYFTPAEGAKFGAKEGVAWIPVHPSQVASAGGTAQKAGA